MITGFLKNRKQDPKLNNDLEDLFARPIKAIVEEPVKTEFENEKELVQEGDEKLSALQVQVLFPLTRLNLTGKK
jgi:hypothetical protein